MTPSAPAMQTAGEAVDKPLERATLGERCDALKTARARRWTGQPTSPPRTGGPVVPPTAPPAVTRGGSASPTTARTGPSHRHDHRIHPVTASASPCVARRTAVSPGTVTATTLPPPISPPSSNSNQPPGHPRGAVRHSPPANAAVGSAVAARAAAARATSVSGAVRRRVPRRAASSTLRHRRDRYARYASDKTAAGRYWRRVRRRRHAVGCPRVTRSSMWNQTTRDPAPQSRSKLCRTWPGGCPVR